MSSTLNHKPSQTLNGASPTKSPCIAARLNSNTGENHISCYPETVVYLSHARNHSFRACVSASERPASRRFVHRMPSRPMDNSFPACHLIFKSYPEPQTARAINYIIIHKTISHESCIERMGFFIQLHPNPRLHIDVGSSPVSHAAASSHDNKRQHFLVVQNVESEIRKNRDRHSGFFAFAFPISVHFHSRSGSQVEKIVELIALRCSQAQPVARRRISA